MTLTADEERWAAEYLRQHHDFLVDDVSALMTEEQLLRLPEYSCSLPTGTYQHKRWRCADRRLPSGWRMGEYLAPVGDRVPILWREVLLA